MAKKRPAIKLNKKHGGKEFKSFFHFVGKVSPVTKFENGERVEQDYFDDTPTKTGKEKKKLEFNIETAKDNHLKVQISGMKFDKAYAYSQEHSKVAVVDWDDRFDKSQLPDDTYHFMDTDWDKIDEFVDMVQDDEWVEVKGHYEFGSFIDSEKGKVNFFRRCIDSMEQVVDGQEIKAGRSTLVESYATDFDSEDFQEVNHFNMQIGINTVYQEDDEDKEVKVNAYYLDYGKERSTPHDVKLKIEYKEPEEGKMALSDAFSNLNRLDFVEVSGTDNNRVTYADVADDSGIDEEEDPFADVGEEDKTTKTKRAVSGTDKGLKITSVVDGSYKKELLTEDEVKEDEPAEVFNDSGNESAEEDPFADVANEDDPFA